MVNSLKTLKDEVESFQAWAYAYPVDERSGEWELDYDGWSNLYDAFVNFIAATTCQQWDATTSGMLLYVIARDNEMGQLVRAVGQDPENLLCLAERSFASAEPDAKWQIAVELSRLDLPRMRAEPILLRFAHDDNEYVRRRALMALADIKSLLAVCRREACRPHLSCCGRAKARLQFVSWPQNGLQAHYPSEKHVLSDTLLVNDLAVPAWNTGLEYERMAVLKALDTLGSPLLNDYLIRAEGDGRQRVVEYAARVRAGTAN